MENTRELYQLEMGAVAVFLAWMNFLLYLQRWLYLDFFVSVLLYLFRFEALGIYIVMFVEVVKTLLVVSSYFLCI